ncbi:aspartic peptidase domain-containing protein [Gloeopeniophorella convolvens]|nr:aspartic peptidase domain-containing protein [Gloeopeniophorella convolvens]
MVMPQDRYLDAQHGHPRCVCTCQHYAFIRRGFCSARFPLSARYLTFRLGISRTARLRVVDGVLSPCLACYCDGAVLIPTRLLLRVYTVAVQVGTNNQNFSLQVDTGSSDLWIASTSCSSSACSGSKGRQYDPSASGVNSGIQFNINYLAGEVIGPIYWDQLQLGGYSIDNQALAAATTVNSEPLEHEFDGILGLALPLNSIIAQTIPPVNGNGRDGAAFASNLFGITPVDTAPASRFLSMSLSRPGSDAIPSLLGVGRHPSEIVSDPSKITYSTLVQEREGILFWEAEVRTITVYVNGTALPVSLKHSRSGNVFPTAVLDSGVPVILATSDIANGIYGALGIGPAADGNYYVPCTTPLNMTITLDGQFEIPLHPLDLTTESQDDPSSTSCVGLIQTANGQMDTLPNVSDMILGVAFLRNVYTVMAYDTPNAQGLFPVHGNTTQTVSDQIHPQLGLLGLTNPTQALQEFNNVRVLKQPLSSNTGPTAPSGKDVTSGSKKLSVGIDVLLGLVGIIGACIALFALRWFLVKRRLRQQGPQLESNFVDDKNAGAAALGGYQLARRRSRSSSDSAPVRKSPGISITANSANTYIGDEHGLNEFGLRKPKDPAEQDHERQVSYLNLDPGDSSIGWRDTLVGDPVDFPQPEPKPVPTPEPADASTPTSAPTHRHTASDVGAAADGPGAAEPLLAHVRDDSGDADLAEFGLGAGLRTSMAGIGTAARSPRIRARHGSSGGSGTSPVSSRFPSMSMSVGERMSAYSVAEEAVAKAPPPSS